LVLDEVGIIIASVIAGLGGGFLSSWMSFNASGEEFDRRKHGNALITGAIAGMAAGVAFAVVLPKDATGPQIALSLFSTFFTTVGIDRLRTTGSKMATKDQFDKMTEMIKSGKLTPAVTTTTPSTTTTLTETKKEEVK
jgi:NADPH:quinone reductase-like Zn-dependent oxidoreductase